MSDTPFVEHMTDALTEFISAVVTASAWLYVKNALEVQHAYERAVST